MRFYWRAKEGVPLQKLLIQMTNGEFYYGFEYLGVGEKLVHWQVLLDFDSGFALETQWFSPRPHRYWKDRVGQSSGVVAGKVRLLVFNCDETFNG